MVNMDFDNEQTTISNFSPSNMALDFNHYFNIDWSIMLLGVSDPSKSLHHDCKYILFTLNHCQRPNYLLQVQCISH
jgi:hypothetical protein